MKGKIMIRKGSEFNAPVVVCISHFNLNHGLWTAEILNTDTLVLVSKDDVIPFNYRTFKKMFYKWKMDNSDFVKKRFENLLAEWN